MERQVCILGLDNGPGPGMSDGIAVGGTISTTARSTLFFGPDDQTWSNMCSELGAHAERSRRTRQIFDEVRPSTPTPSPCPTHTIQSHFPSRFESNICNQAIKKATQRAILEAIEELKCNEN